MPQIDFGQAFSDVDVPASSAPREGVWPVLKSPARDLNELSKFRRTRLGRSEWTNIFFTVTALLGGLFCAFYFFNGSELLRAALSWPREYLYAQPRAGDNSPADRLRLAAALGMAAPGETRLPGANSGDPFSSTRDLLSLNPPASRQGRSTTGGNAASGFVSGSGGLPGGLSNAGSFLSGLGLPAPGGDALMQVFNSAVSDLQRVTKLNAQRTVVVVQTAVARMEKRSKSREKNVVGIGQNRTNNTVGQTTSQIGHAPTSATSTASSATTTTQQTINSARGGVSGLGGGLGGLRGGISGGVGGLGGSLGGHGGLGGGRGR